MVLFRDNFMKIHYTGNAQVQLIVDGSDPIPKQL